MTPAHRLSAAEVCAFTEAFLWERFDEPVPVSQFHLKLWKLACAEDRYVAIAAPRDHSKTTSITKARGLATALYRQHPFQLKIGKTLDLAIEVVRWCRDEMLNNEKIIHAFKPKIVQDQVDDLIVELPGGYQFRWVAMGMNQAKRGFVWGTRRPTLVDMDDVEDSEESLNPEIRARDGRTLRRVILPMGKKGAEIRMVGTVVHQESLLNTRRKNKQWVFKRFEACDENVSRESLLWPAKWPKEELENLKQTFVQDGDLAGFNMEYRNLAIDASTSFFQPTDFLPMKEEDHKKRKTYYVGGDLAFSAKEHRDWTVFVVGGVDEDGILHIVDERRGRWDGNEVIDEMYAINEAWSPQEYFIESGAIKETLGAALEIRMAEEGYLNIQPGLVPTKDKGTRATPAQARMRGRGMRFDMAASWFGDFQQELLEFTRQGTRGAHDDRVDAFAWLVQGLKGMSLPLNENEEEKVILLEARRKARAQSVELESCTGYEFHRAQSWG